MCLRRHSSLTERTPEHPLFPICESLPDLMGAPVQAPRSPGWCFPAKAQGSQEQWRETSVNPHTIASYILGSLGSQSALNPPPKCISDKTPRVGHPTADKMGVLAPYAPHTPHLLTLSERDIHQPLVKVLDPPEIVDHLSGGWVIHMCAVQSSLQS